MRFYVKMKLLKAIRSFFMSKFFAFLTRMKYIKRWSLMRSVREETIMEHSQEVAVVAHILALINNKIFGGSADAGKTVLLAQYHEVSEVITGDLPTPIKYFNPEINTAYKELEVIADKKLLAMLPEEFKEDYEKIILPDTESVEYKLVKIADRLSAYLKCVEEVKAGNSEFKKAKASILADVKSKNCKEADYFLKTFAPAFELALDELD